LPEWAPAFADAVRSDGDDIISKSGGDERRFGLRVDGTLGVVDFLAAVGPNQYVLGAVLRIVPRAKTSEVGFTLLRLPSESDGELEARALVVAQELSTIRERLTQAAGS
jgi:hypothetical protein